MTNALLAMVVILGVSRMFVLDEEYPEQLWGTLYGASAAATLSLAVWVLIEACGK